MNSQYTCFDGYVYRIDSCIGADNHRSFLLAMSLFVITSYYGSYLTVTSICGPLTWLPDDTCISRAYRKYE